MSTHCNRYPKCGCPKDIGKFCGLSDAQLSDFLTKETNELLEILKSDELSYQDLKERDRLQHEEFGGNARRARS